MAAPGSSYTQSPQYPPYPPPGPELSQGGYPPPNSGWRPEWGPYHSGIPAYPGNPHASPGANLSNQSSPASANRPSMDKSRRKRLSHDQQHPLAHQQQVYSFVPIPGAQQHKRPRRRYEEIERMYKCGWNGCEKAYGTLNHLNAHVTMQSHGQKRTPEEFKEIRKEWKARKKEEEAAARKAEEEQQRQSRQMEGTSLGEASQTQTSQYGPISPRQLPPLGYQQQGVQHGVHYNQGQSNMETLPQYPPSNAMYAGYSHSPQYTHSQNQTMYQPRQTQLHQGHEENDADAEPDPDVPPSTYTH